MCKDMLNRKEVIEILKSEDAFAFLDNYQDIKLIVNNNEDLYNFFNNEECLDDLDFSLGKLREFKELF